MRKDDFRDFVIGQLGDLRGLDCEAIYDGYALRCDKTFFAIVSKGRLYFRVNDATRPAFAAAKSGPLRTGGGKFELGFLEVPAAVVQSPPALVEWAEQAILGARAVKQGRKRKVRHR